MFEKIADSLGFPVDQIRYVILLFLSFPLAYVLRHTLHLSHTSLLTRHVYSLSLGLLFGFLCFGMQMFILFGVVIVCYGLLMFVPAATVQRYTMVWAMGCMSAAHFYRLITDYGGWHLDFTGPLMLIVQKVTLTAFALHDGKARKDSSLNADQRAQKIDECPSILQYFTYVFNFHTFLAGPVCTFREFTAFMDGSNLRPADNSAKSAKEPSAAFSILTKFLYSIVALLLHVFLSRQITLAMTLDPKYPFLTRLFIVELYGYVFKSKYYFVWLLVDSVNNTCGLGFNGYDKLGYPKWDLITNVSVYDLELATNMRAYTVRWNITSARWLRRVCYERITFFPTVMTFLLSAWWHGFYPGYYFCFLFVAILTVASRKMRWLLRHHFQSSVPLKWFYDVITHLCTRVCLACIIVVFDVLWAPQGLLFWSYTYYIPHVLILVVALFFPSGKRPLQVKEDKGQSIDQDIKTKSD